MLQLNSYRICQKWKSLWFICIPIVLQSQSFDASRWDDFYSYSSVKNIILSSTKLYATVATGAFSYDTLTQEKEKLSTVNGLSGDVNASVYYSEENSTLIIGYENGLLELIKDDGSVKKVVDILVSEISSIKRINELYEQNNKLYLSTQFGIVVYDLEKEEFQDTYFIGNNSSLIDVSSVVISGGFIYASSNEGVYIADMNTNLNDWNNWNLNFTGAFDNLLVFNNQVIVAKEENIYQINTQSSLELVVTLSETILDVETDNLSLIAGGENIAEVYDVNYNQLYSLNPTGTNISSVELDGNSIYLGTDSMGILRSEFSDVDDFVQIEIQGPIQNDIFALDAGNNDLWVVYGAYNEAFNFTGTKMGPSHFDGNSWVHVPYSSEFQSRDLVDVLIDPTHDNRVYVSSYYKGVLVVENDQSVDMINTENNGLGYWQHSSNFSLVTKSKFDVDGNLWVANSWGKDTKLLSKLEDDVTVAQIDFSSVVDRGEQYASIYDMDIGADNHVWLGTYFEGVFVTDGESVPKVHRLSLEEDNLPSNVVYAVAADLNNRIWIGTNLGLVVFDDVENVFTGNYQRPEPVIIVVDGVASELLGSATINDIYVDGANNKWFATSSGGVVQTNASGQKILASFTTENSPLPSNDILKIEMDESTGRIYFLTSRGIISYDTEIAPYGERLSEVYGFPNPSLKQHNTVSLVGKDGVNLPEGTNIKIVDVAGNLVFESNTVESSIFFRRQDSLG